MIYNPARSIWYRDNESTPYKGAKLHGFSVEQLSPNVRMATMAIIEDEKTFKVKTVMLSQILFGMPS